MHIDHHPNVGRIELGTRFDRLTVLGRAPKRGKTGDAWWRCRCDCGGSKDVRGYNLRFGKVRSCGCLQIEGNKIKAESNVRHGHARRGLGSSTHRSWDHMKQRCLNPKSDGYQNYGGRGIKVCKRWLSFANFLNDMGERPAGTTLERIDNDGNYELSNCRWATMREQTENNRRNRIIEFNETRLCLTRWAEKVGMRPSALRGRIRRGWPIERALTESMVPRGQRFQRQREWDSLSK